MVGKVRTLLLFWAVLLLVSLLILIVGLRQASQALSIGVPPLTLPMQPDDAAEGTLPDGGGEGGANNASWMLGLSVVSAAVSAAGFVVTTFFALRTDRRETALHDLQVANLRAEIARQALEIERLQRNRPAPPQKG